MNYSITLTPYYKKMTVRTLLEDEWLVPRKVRHFLRTRKNVSINGKTANFHDSIHPGDTITLEFFNTDYVLPFIQHGDANQIVPLYEDEHLLVVDKPAGIKTHPNHASETDTLLNHAAAYLTDSNQLPYIVHRLDKETSGVLLLAKNPFVLPILGRMLEKKQIKRTYQGKVSGQMKQEKMTISKKIGRDRHDRRKRCIDQHNGQLAITHIKKIQTLKNQTWVECQLDTGRTHQIRVHLNSIGYPLIGDPLYGDKSQRSDQRLQLHASELKLVHPFTKEELCITSKQNFW